MNRYLFIIVVVIALTSCSTTNPAEDIINKAIVQVGGEHYNHKKITFEFRGKIYTSCRNDGMYTLARKSNDSAEITDILSNTGFKRFINGNQVTLADTTATKFANSTNSVHYFAYLPYGLTGSAVNKELLGEVEIKDHTYYKIKVWFDQQGGGEDYEDVFIYWVEAETFQVDYLAYEFHVNGGGLRFREAYNRRDIEGIQFVDYNNYAPNDTIASIAELDHLFQQNSLKLLSKIELKNINVESSTDCGL